MLIRLAESGDLTPQLSGWFVEGNKNHERLGGYLFVA